MKARIELTGPGRGQIYLDGVKQDRTVGFWASGRVGKGNRLVIEYAPDILEIEGDFGPAAESGDSQ